jgi:hypothetical protein
LGVTAKGVTNVQAGGPDLFAYNNAMFCFPSSLLPLFYPNVETLLEKPENIVKKFVDRKQ